MDAPNCYLNVEVSGIPRHADDPQQDQEVLIRVRHRFERYMRGSLLPRGRYKCYSGIPVTVTGEGFWDSSHPSGNIGPGRVVKSPWELHPVTWIRFPRGFAQNNRATSGRC